MGRIDAHSLGLTEQPGLLLARDGRLAGQDPGELVVGEVQDVAARVDQGVRVVVRVQHPVVAVWRH